MSPAIPGIDPNKTLVDLDTDELEQVCQSTKYPDYGLDATQLLRWNCYVSAIAVHQSTPSLDCDSLATSCITAGPQPTTDKECMFDPSQPVDLGTCASVTVADIDSCVNALDAFVQSMVDGVSCSTSPEVLGTPPSECTTVLATCPDLFGK